MNYLKTYEENTFNPKIETPYIKVILNENIDNLIKIFKENNLKINYYTYNNSLILLYVKFGVYDKLPKPLQELHFEILSQSLLISFWKKISEEEAKTFLDSKKFGL